MTTRNYTKARFSVEDAALILIDHQSGIMQLVHDYSPAEFCNNVLALAKIAKVYDLPTVITSSYEQGPNGPIIPELLALLPDAPVVRRPAQISAWDNEDFVAAVKKTGRKNLIMAGVTVDVCLAYPAMQAVADGFNVYGVVDASRCSKPRSPADVHRASHRPWRDTRDLVDGGHRAPTRLAFAHRAGSRPTVPRAQPQLWHLIDSFSALTANAAKKSA
jgi:nicotinamidase-related amidase